MAPPKPTPTRKRNRKRKRRAASSSSSDGDSSSDSDASRLPTGPKALPPVRVPSTAPSPDDEDTSSCGDESSEDESVHHEVALQKLQTSTDTPRRSLSPDRRPCPVPPLPENSQDKEVLRQRFRKFWMASVADAFSDDLGEIRKEPNLSTSRLSILIDSLAAGADVFASPSESGDADANEMNVAMGHP